MNNKFKYALLSGSGAVFCTALLVFGSWGCKSTPNVQLSSCTSVTDSTKVSFNNDLKPILASKCATSGCHTAGHAAAGLNLDASTAYTVLSRSGSGYIDVNNPEASVIISAMESGNKPMPPSGNLDACTIKKFAAWMKQKAPNN